MSYKLTKCNFTTKLLQLPVNYIGSNDLILKINQEKLVESKTYDPVYIIANNQIK